MDIKIDHNKYDKEGNEILYSIDKHLSYIQKLVASSHKHSELHESDKPQHWI